VLWKYQDMSYSFPHLPIEAIDAFETRAACIKASINSRKNTERDAGTALTGSTSRFYLWRQTRLDRTEKKFR
jgi:hypothetical protein